MGKWIEEAERKLTCARCHARVEEGQRFWYARKGVYYCELCGSIAEHEEPEVGEHESGVLEDLKQLPPEAADRTLAKTMLMLARRIDSGDVADRDYPAMIQQLRQLLGQLKLDYPPEPEDDDTEKSRKKREAYLRATGDFEE